MSIPPSRKRLIVGLLESVARQGPEALGTEVVEMDLTMDRIDVPDDLTALASCVPVLMSDVADGVGDELTAVALFSDFVPEFSAELLPAIVSGNVLHLLIEFHRYSILSRIS